MTRPNFLIATLIGFVAAAAMAAGVVLEPPSSLNGRTGDSASVSQSR